MTRAAREVLAGARPVSLEEECAFFSCVRTHGGVWKTTAANRMDDVDAAFRAQYRGPRTPRIMDAGASSGISTLQWRDDLLRHGLVPRMVATDLTIDAVLTRWSHDHYVLSDRDGHVLQHEVGGLVMGPDEFVYLAPPPACPARPGPLHGLRAAAQAAYWRVAGGRAWHRRTVRLTSAYARDITFLEDDVLVCGRPALLRRFDAVRAANLLNRCYFADAVLAQAVGNLGARLRGAGGMLVINRTHEDGSNHGSLFVLGTDGRFGCVARVGGGSEIEAIVLEVVVGE